MGKEHWVKSEWTPTQLHGKTVEFRLHDVEGHGRFRARQRPDGNISVQIEAYRQGKDEAEMISRHRFLREAEVDAIRQNPEGAKYGFSCFVTV